MGRLDDIDGDIFIRYYSALRNIAKDFQEKPEDLESGTQIGYWYYGKTGVGKTHSANEDFPDAYRKISNNKWWDGYQDQPYVIIDDLDKSHNYMGYHLKIWADRYAFIAEMKGSSRYIRPKVVCVTSNYRPQDIWEDDTTLGPILRRFKVVHFQSMQEAIFGEPGETTRGAYVPGFVVPTVPAPILASEAEFNTQEANIDLNISF